MNAGAFHIYIYSEDYSGLLCINHQDLTPKEGMSSW